MKDNIRKGIRQWLSLVLCAALLFSNMGVYATEGGVVSASKATSDSAAEDMPLTIQNTSQSTGQIRNLTVRSGSSTDDSDFLSSSEDDVNYDDQVETYSPKDYVSEFVVATSSLASLGDTRTKTALLSDSNIGDDTYDIELYVDAEGFTKLGSNGSSSYRKNLSTSSATSGIREISVYCGGQSMTGNSSNTIGSTDYTEGWYSWDNVHYTCCTNGLNSKIYGEAEYGTLYAIVRAQYKDTSTGKKYWFYNSAQYELSDYDDYEMPEITGVTQSPKTTSSKWSNQPVTITINATGSAGINGYFSNYTMGQPTAAYTGWKSSNQFSWSRHGFIYCFARGADGNVTDWTATYIYYDANPPTASISCVGSTMTVTATDSSTSTSGASGVKSYYWSTSSTAPSTSADGWSTTAKTYTATSAGTYYCYVQDKAGNVGVASYEVTDTIAPTLNTFTASTSAWTNQAVTLTASATDMIDSTTAGTIAGYYFSQSSTAPTASTSGWQTGNTKSVSSNGVWYCWAKDAGGNISNRMQVTVKYDKSAPSLSVTQTKQSDGTALLTATVTDTATDGVSGASGVTKYYWSRVAISDISTINGWANVSTYTMEYNTTLYCYVMDEAGNTAYEKVDVSTVTDEKAPTIDGVAQSPIAWTKDKVTLTVYAHDTGGLSAAPYSYDNQKTWTTENTYQVTKNGTYTICVRDTSGNVATTTYSVTNIDTTAPKVTLKLDGDVLKATVTETGSGIRGYYWIRDDATQPTENANWQSNKTEYTVTANGTYYCYVMDNAGNIGKTTYQVEALDTTAPDLGVPEAEITGWTNQPITITATATDDKSSVVKFYFSTVLERPEKGTSGWTPENKKQVMVNGTWYVWAMDESGNISPAKSVTVKYDATAPKVKVESLNTDKTNGSVTLSATASDEPDTNSGESGVKGYFWTDDDTVPTANSIWTTRSVYQVSENGDYTCYVLDKAGNVSEGYTICVRNIVGAYIESATYSFYQLDDGITRTWANIDAEAKIEVDAFGENLVYYFYRTTEQNGDITTVTDAIADAVAQDKEPTVDGLVKNTVGTYTLGYPNGEKSAQAVSGSDDNGEKYWYVWAVDLARKKVSPATPVTDGEGTQVVVKFDDVAPVLNDFTRIKLDITNDGNNYSELTVAHVDDLGGSKLDAYIENQFWQVNKTTFRNGSTWLFWSLPGVTGFDNLTEQYFLDEAGNRSNTVPFKIVELEELDAVKPKLEITAQAQQTGNSYKLAVTVTDPLKTGLLEYRFTADGESAGDVDAEDWIAIDNVGIDSDTINLELTGDSTRPYLQVRTANFCSKLDSDGGWSYYKGLYSNVVKMDVPDTPSSLQVESVRYVYTPFLNTDSFYSKIYTNTNIYNAITWGSYDSGARVEVTMGEDSGDNLTYYYLSSESELAVSKLLEISQGLSSGTTVTGMKSNTTGVYYLGRTNGEENGSHTPGALDNGESYWYVWVKDGDGNVTSGTQCKIKETPNATEWTDGTVKFDDVAPVLSNARQYRLPDFDELWKITLWTMNFDNDGSPLVGWAGTRRRNLFASDSYGEWEMWAASGDSKWADWENNYAGLYNYGIQYTLDYASMVIDSAGNISNQVFQEEGLDLPTIENIRTEITGKNQWTVTVDVNDPLNSGTLEYRWTDGTEELLEGWVKVENYPEGGHGTLTLTTDGSKPYLQLKAGNEYPYTQRRMYSHFQGVTSELYLIDPTYLSVESAVYSFDQITEGFTRTWANREAEPHITVSAQGDDLHYYFWSGESTLTDSQLKTYADNIQAAVQNKTYTVSGLTHNQTGVYYIGATDGVAGAYPENDHLDNGKTCWYVWVANGYGYVSSGQAVTGEQLVDGMVQYDDIAPKTVSLVDRTLPNASSDELARIASVVIGDDLGGSPLWGVYNVAKNDTIPSRNSTDDEELIFYQGTTAVCYYQDFKSTVVSRAVVDAAGNMGELLTSETNDETNDPTIAVTKILGVENGKYTVRVKVTDPAYSGLVEYRWTAEGDTTGVDSRDESDWVTVSDMTVQNGSDTFVVEMSPEKTNLQVRTANLDSRNLNGASYTSNKGIYSDVVTLTVPELIYVNDKSLNNNQVYTDNTATPTLMVGQADAGLSMTGATFALEDGEEEFAIIDESTGVLTGKKQGTVHVTMTLGGVTFTQEVEVIGAETYDVTLNILEGKWQAWDTTFFNQNNSYKLNRYKEGTWNIAVTNHDSLSLITPNEVKSNYNKWGYDSANSKIALVLYNIDGDETVLGAGSTVTDFRGIRLYNAAAYNCQEDRTFTITLTQVEDENQIIVLNVTIPGVTSKTLDVTVSINQPTVTLEQQNTIATTDVQTFTNNTAYPVTIAMNSVEAKTDEGNTELTVVKKERDFGEDDSLLTEGVALGVMLADESEDNMIYYDPDDSQENTSFDTMVGTSLEDVGETKFQYFIEYGTNYASFAKVRQFGYDITFSVAVSRDDVEVPAQSEDEE